MAAQSKGSKSRNVLDLSNTAIMGSNITRSMDVCVFSLSIVSVISSEQDRSYIFNSRPEKRMINIMKVLPSQHKHSCNVRIVQWRDLASTEFSETRPRTKNSVQS